MSGHVVERLGSQNYRYRGHSFVRDYLLKSPLRYCTRDQRLTYATTKTIKEMTAYIDHSLAAASASNKQAEPAVKAADRAPTIEEITALRKIAAACTTLEGSRIEVNVYEGSVFVAVDGCNVFRATARWQVELKAYSRPKD